MKDDDAKRLAADQDGLATYEYIANNIETCHGDMDTLVGHLVRADRTGQFTASAARYLHAVDADAFAPAIDALIKATITLDREHRYLRALMTSVWGDDCCEHAAELAQADDNFRRIYKRLFPRTDSL